MAKIKDYSMKYKFQWWYYSHGGEELVDNAAMTLMLFGGGYMMCYTPYIVNSDTLRGMITQMETE